MRTVRGSVLAMLLALWAAAPAAAFTTRIEATAPLPDRSQAAIEAALMEAMAAAARSALAMGFPWVSIERTRVLEDRVSVELLATDTDPEGGERPESEAR